MAANLADHSERSDLVRGLGLWSATAIVIGDTIGTGVFLVASDMARAVGSAKLVLAAWILGLFIVLLGAFCYAELGAAFPKAGSPYVNRAWGYPCTPLIFLAAAIALTVNLWMVRPVRSSLGLAVILLGIPFFYRRHKRPPATVAPFEQN
jgi:amino acid permease